MLKILFLDDNDDRHMAYDENMGQKADITHVHTVKECIKAMEEEGPFDVFSLDHDLGGKAYVEEIEGHGTEVALYIRDSLSEDKLPQAVIIHSWNPAGALRMENVIQSRLRNVRRVPFSY
jgi:CheY-like chemotaxis protein